MKQMKKMLSILLALALTFSIAVDVPVFAAEEEEPVAVERDLALNVWKTSSLEKGGVEWWQVTLPVSGWMNVKVQLYGLYAGGVEIYDADKAERINYDSDSGASASNPKTMTFKEPLRAGTYWIKVSSNYNSVGSYKIWANEDSRPVTTVDSNSTFDSPQTIGLNQQVTGFFSRQDRVDIFRVVLPSATKLHYTARSKDISDLTYIDYTLYNANYEEMESDYFYMKEPRSWDSNTVLQAGIYYIKITPRYNNNSGSYVFSCGQRYMVSSIAISGKKTLGSGKQMTLKAVVGPANAANKAIDWSSSNTSIATVDSNGVVKASTSYCGLVTITATSEDNPNVSAKFQFHVLPGKMTISSVYNYYYGRKTWVSSYGAYGAHGYQIQYSTNQKFQGAHTKKFRKSSNYIYKLKRKKLYFFRERAYIKVGKKVYYGPWSKAKRCRINH